MSNPGNNSWKNYGGTYKSDNLQNISIGTLVADNVLLRQDYSQELKVEGGLSVKGNATVGGQSLNVKNNTFTGYLYTSNDAYINNKLYFGTNQQVTDAKQRAFITGTDSNIGINTTTLTGGPYSALDVVGLPNVNTILTVRSNTFINRNIISENTNQHGMIAYTEDKYAADGKTLLTSSSSIQFIVDSSINNIQDKPVQPIDAQINYVWNNTVEKGCLDINSLYVRFDASNSIFSPRGDLNDSTSFFNESVIIYDASAKPFLVDVYNDTSVTSGNSLSLVGVDQSSNNFLRLITPQLTGLSIGGGSYPLDITRSMGTIGINMNIKDAYNNPLYHPSQVIVAGNSIVNYKSTIGVNTYAPQTEKYTMDINGPVRFGNGELTTVSSYNFEITQMTFSKNNPDIGIICGKPVNNPTPGSSNPYFLFTSTTTDGGKTWSTPSRIDSTTGVALEKNYLVVQSNKPIITDMAVYVLDSKYAVIGCKTNAISALYYSNNGGNNWAKLTYNDTAAITKKTRNFKTICISSYLNTNTVFLTGDNLDTTQFSSYATFTNARFDAGTTISFDDTPMPVDIISPSNTYLNNFNTSTAPNSCDLCGNVLYYAGKGIKKYNIGTGTTSFINIYNSTQVYNSIFAFDCSYVVAVGNKVISYTKDGTTWLNSTVNNITDFSLNSVFLYDNLNGLAVGNAGIFLYTKDGALTWNIIPDNILNSSGISNILTGKNNALSGINIQDINSFVVSNITQRYTQSTGSDNIISKPGKSKIIYGFFPNLFNRINNTVLDVSGNMFISGDVNINEGGKLASTNDTFYLLNENVNTIEFGGGAERFDIGNQNTNTYINGNVFVSIDTSLNGNLYVNKKTILNKDVSANTRLFLSGDASLNSRLYVSNDVSANSRLFLGGDASLNSRLFVDDDVSANSRFFLGGDASLNSRLFVDDDVSANSRFFLGGDASLNSRLYVSNDISANRRLFLGGDASLNSRLFVANDVSANSRFFLGGDASLNSRLFVANDVSANSRFFLGGDASLNSRLYVSNDISANRRLFLGGDASLNSRLFVANDVSANSRFFLGGDASLNSRLYVSNDISANSRFFLGGDASLNSRLFVDDDVSANSRFFLGGDASLNSRLFVANDIDAKSRFFLGGDASLNGRLFVVLDSTINGLTVGRGSGYNITNTALGNEALFNNTTGANNLAVGYQSLQNNTGGNFNVAIGGFSGNSNTTGIYNTFIGSNTNTSDTYNYSTALGYNATIYGSNQIVLGTPSETVIIKGDSSFNNRLFVQNDVSMNGNLSVFNTIYAPNIDNISTSSLNIGCSPNSANIFIGYNNNSSSITIGSQTANTTKTIYIGNAGDNVKIRGNVDVINTTQLVVDSNTIILNDKTGQPSSGSGLFIYDNTNVINSDPAKAGQFIVSNDMLSFVVKAPGSSNIVKMNTDSMKYTTGTYASSNYTTGNAIMVISPLTNDNDNANMQMTTSNLDTASIFLNSNSTSTTTQRVSTKVILGSSILSPDPTLPAVNSNRLYVAGDTVIEGNLTIKDQFFTEMKLQFTTDVSINEFLYVGRDTSLNSRLFVGSELLANSSFILRGDASLNNRLFVDDDVSANARFFLGGDASLNSRLFVSNDVSVNSRFFLGGDASLNSRLFVSNDVSVNSRFFLGGDASLNRRLFVSNDVSVNSRFFLGGDASLSSRLFVANDISANARMFLGGDASLSSRLFVANDISANSRLFLGGDASINGNVSIGGTGGIKIGNMIISNGVIYQF